MKKVFLPIPELFSIYAMQFFRTVLIVGLNLSIARFLISSELFGDFRVAVKFMLILGTVLFMLYPLLERAIRGFSSSQRGLIYSAVILGITGLLNGAYIISRNVVHDWSIVDYLNHHPIHILLFGVIIFTVIQIIAARGSALAIERMNSISYFLFAVSMLVAILLLPELDMAAMVAVFLFSQMLLLGISWAVYQLGPKHTVKTHHSSGRVNLMHQSGLALSLFVLEIFSPREIDVTYFAIIMTLASLMFVVTQPLSKSLEDLDDWVPEYLPQVSKLMWINALFSSTMFLLLMPLSRVLLGWIDGGIVLDLSSNEPMLMPLRIALVGFMLITWLRPFFSILMRYNGEVAKRVQFAKLILLLVLLLVLVPPYGLYGAIASELMCAASIYGFILFYLFDKGAVRPSGFSLYDL